MFLREVWRPEKLNSEADSRVEWAAMLVGQGLAPVQDMLFRILESGTRVFYIRKITAQPATCLSCRKYQVAVDKKGGEEHVVI